MALSSGTRFGPYEILSPIGAGGMGEVYRAKDTRLDRTVAIKVLPSHLSSNPELKQRMEREAKAISALQHANIDGSPRLHWDRRRWLSVQSGFGDRQAR